MELQEAMQMLKKIDSVPKDETLVLYTKGKLTRTQYDFITKALGRLNESGDVGQVIVLPHDELELKQLTNEDRKRLLELLEPTGQEIAGLVYNWLDKQNMHPDDFDMLFAEELMSELKRDKGAGE